MILQSASTTGNALNRTYSCCHEGKEEQRRANVIEELEGGENDRGVERVASKRVCDESQGGGEDGHEDRQRSKSATKCCLESA